MAARPFAGVAASLVLHAAALPLAVTMFPRSTVLAPLVVELTAPGRSGSPTIRPTERAGAQGAGRGARRTAVGDGAAVRPASGGPVDAGVDRETTGAPGRAPTIAGPSEPLVTGETRTQGVEFMSAPQRDAAEVPGAIAGVGIAAPASGNASRAGGDPDPGAAASATAGQGGAPAGDGRPERSGGGSAGTSEGGGMQALASAGAEAPVEYAAYLTALRRRIQEILEYPAAARRRGLTGTVHLEVVILATGSVGRVSVVRSSSHAMLDEAARAAVLRLTPPPPPPALRPRALTVRLPVVFDLR